MRISRSASSPLRLSVVVPYYDRRFSASTALESWCKNQTFPAQRYEVLLVLNESESIDPAAEEALGSVGRVISIKGTNSAELYHAGATGAAADFLFFTEIHCIAEPDCLAKLDAYLTETGYPGACIASYGDNSNAFATAECRIFERLFSEWSKPGRWEKVMLRGFAIEKQTYFENGGFVSRYNRFSDQVLAARLAETGVQLGYADQARVKHFYNTHGGQFYHHETLRALDEFRFRAENPPDYCEKYFGTHPDWDNRRAFDRGRSRNAALALLRSLFCPRSSVRPLPASDESIVELGRWARTALLGPWPELVASKLHVLWLGLLSICFRNDTDRLESLYLRAYRACARYNFLCYISQHLSEKLDHSTFRATWPIEEIPATDLVGFHPIEIHEGRSFRWTGAAGIVLLKTPPAPFRLIIEFARPRSDPRAYVSDLFFNSKRIKTLLFDHEAGTLSAEIHEAWIKKNDPQEILIVSKPIPAHETGTGENRTLGAPIGGIRFERDASPVATPTQQGYLCDLPLSTRTG